MNRKKLDNYIEKCFADAFISEDKDYDRKSYSVNYVIIYDSMDIGHFYSLMTCRYRRVLRRVNYRLKNNIEKNFGLLYGDSNEFRCSVDPFSTIDANFTRAMVAKKNNKKKKFGIFIVDDLDKLPISGGRYIPAYRYEQLLRTYYNVEEKDYDKVAFSEYGFGYPTSLMHDWDSFKKLWKDTFNQDICPYKIIVSDGLIRL